MGEFQKIEFLIGETIYGQPIRLIYRQETGGRYVWELHRDAANQRDDHVFITGMTVETIRRIGQAVDMWKSSGLPGSRAGPS
jgi:hypothetical protein